MRTINLITQPETHAQKNPAFPKGGVLLGKLCFPIRKNHPRKQTRELRHLFDRQWRVHLQAQPQPIRQASASSVASKAERSNPTSVVKNRMQGIGALRATPQDFPCIPR